MKQIQLEFELTLDGYTFLVTYCTAGKNLAMLESISLCGFPIDIAELVTDKQFEKYVNDIQYAMRNNCNGYWQEQLQVA